MRLTTLVVSVFAMLFAMPALAQPEEHHHHHRRHRAIIEESIRQAEERTVELERIAQKDVQLARELREGARRRDAAAQVFDAKGIELAEIAAASEGGDRRFLEMLANEQRNFARKDREFAAERNRAAEILEHQARDAEEGIRFHREQLVRLREHLERTRW